MKGEGARHLLARRQLQQPFVEHEAGAVIALLARLEHQEHAPGQLLAPGHEEARGSQQHRHVGVVAAGVHRARLLGGELQPRLLGQRQAVHVGAKEDRRAGASAFDDGGHGGRGRAEPGLEAERAELLDEDRLGRGRCRPISGVRWRRRRRSTVAGSWRARRRGGW